jgi:hypothetical protein
MDEINNNNNNDVLLPAEEKERLGIFDNLSQTFIDNLCSSTSSTDSRTA